MTINMVPPEPVSQESSTRESLTSGEKLAFTPDEFVRRWLRPYRPSGRYVKFRWIHLSEQANLRERILDALVRTVFIYHNDPVEFKGYVADLGYEQAAELFDKRPRDDKTRTGNFGEVVASEYLRQKEGFDLPVYRLRWNTNPDTSMRGEDVLAFKFGEPDGRGRELCIAEAKAEERFDSRTVEDAYKQLATGKRPRPNSIPFVCSVLTLQGEVEKAKAVVQFLNRTSPYPPKRVYFMLIVTGNTPRDPFSAIENLPRVIDNLMTANLFIKDLHDLVTSVFDAPVEV
jgi:HamA